MNSNQRRFTIGVTLMLLVYPCAELFALMFTRADRSDVAPLPDPTVVTWGGLIAVAISFALAVSHYARQKQFTQGLANRLSGVNIGPVANGFSLLIEDMAEDNIAEHLGVAQQ
ncbi:hypothetical protein [Corynebacterium cystitidis]|uniref:hypothetical protein n=1 Tax=Corynebacterium cystitidis TaxID=35757 RepID=UPI00211E8625|nr:hypothetical protein [Corynebacterium cystitidis]